MFTKDDLEKEIVFGSDEELNTLMNEARVDSLTDGRLVVYGVEK